jgi:hypothetical protein
MVAFFFHNRRVPLIGLAGAIVANVLKVQPQALRAL